MRKLPKFDYSVLPCEIQASLAQLRRRRIDFWLVGGFVRDWIAGAISSDVDVVALANPWKIAHAVKGDLIRCRHTIITCGEMQISPAKSLDLAQRDFNANSLAIDSEGNLIDPFGGIEDIRRGELNCRAPLAGDPIRMLRGCRLAARLNWKFGKKTSDAICSLAPKFSLRRETMLRIGLELRKSFDDPQPSAFFRLLHKYGLLGRVCQPLERNWNARFLDKGLEFCDSLTPGSWDQRMTAILQNPVIDPVKNAQRAYSYLLNIKWDLLSSDFGRLAAFPHHASDIASTLLLRNGLPGPADLITFAHQAQALGHLTIPRIRELIRRMHNIEISEQELKNMEAALKKRIASGLPDKTSLKACLSLTGLNKKSIKRRLETAPSVA